MEDSWLLIVGGVFTLGVGIGWTVCWNVYVVPRDERLSALKETLEKQPKSPELDSFGVRPAIQNGLDSPADTVSENPNPVRLLAECDLPVDMIDKSIETLRSRHSLRELRPLETEFPVRHMPVGTYGYVSAFCLDGDRSRLTFVQECKVTRQTDFDSIEIHHRLGGERLVLVFVSETDATRVRDLVGDRDIEVTACIEFTAMFNCYVAVPLNRLVASHRRTIDRESSLMVLDLTLR